MNLLTPYWEYPACVKCAGCSQPLELTWSSSAIGHNLYRARCWTEWKRNKEGNTMSTTPPTTAREALELAWELAHPVKARQVLPEGTACLYRIDDGYQIHETPEGMIARESWTDIRTLDPLPGPEPEWLDAPAVLARLEAGEIATEPEVWIPVGDGMYARAYHNEHTHWQDLRDVTPLYPKEDS